ncbi:hypothetical protein CFC21_089127 [Triticum aestivum]|uniref:Bowman-Birk serine protease inhibitors family domain-containing protein n=3 Tax=Triticum TaxID=4564 RepID=A0A9R0YT25_TRITD|nr:keratin-associated protein 10-1-like [Triticum dicoccoides]XP_044409674.1 keratin-associated protein 10-1-like [Triticum aestivum]KAF7085732.1 hypothetical protein CFC21_089127 [Triticum aestivum]VAI60529.1 unnamed protein product [Triticum turgidum subsp. durum]
MASTAALQTAAVCTLLLFAGQLLPTATPAPPTSCAPGDAKCLACYNKCVEPCRRDPTQCRATLLCGPKCAQQTSSPPPPPPPRESGTCAPANAKCQACVKKCGDRCRRDPTQCRMTMYCEPGCAIQTSSHPPAKDICGPTKAKCLSCVNKCRETCQGDPISCGGLQDCETGCAHQKQ